MQGETWLYVILPPFIWKNIGMSLAHWLLLVLILFNILSAFLLPSLIFLAL